MKKLILLILLIPSLALAHDITLEWDANTEPDIKEYCIYQSQNSGQYTTPVQCISHPNTTAVISVSDGTYFWVATAKDNAGNESAYSNEVTLTVQGGDPSPPNQVRITIIVETN